MCVDNTFLTEFSYLTFAPREQTYIPCIVKIKAKGTDDFPTAPLMLRAVYSSLAALKTYPPPPAFVFRKSNGIL